MADEAVLMFETSLPIPMVCADGAGIEQGAVVKNSDEFLVAITAGNTDGIAGITAAEKIADSGVLTVPVYTKGFFKMVASGNITVNDPVASAGAAFPNRVYVADLSHSGNAILGVSLGTATTGQTVVVQLNPGTGSKVFA
jgi:hypothetical protein